MKPLNVSPRTISFIVPAHNEEALLGATLEALSASARSLGEPHEIIVVDDASTDRTAGIAAERGARVIHVNHRKIAAVRNAGAQASSGDFLFFVDADTVVGLDTLRAAWKALREDGAVGGGARVDFNEVPPRWRLAVKAFMVVYFGLRYAAGCFIFSRRDAFVAAGGFDEHYFASEEVHLSKALRRQGKFVIVRPPVFTSGRKMRMYTMGQSIAQILRILLGGPGALRRREKLGIWYDGRREVAGSGTEGGGGAPEDPGAIRNRRPAP